LINGGLSTIVDANNHFFKIYSLTMIVMKLLKTHIVNKRNVQALLPTRISDSHKGTFGSVAIIGGDDGMVGAVFLSARAALYSGVGRVYAAMLSKMLLLLI